MKSMTCAYGPCTKTIQPGQQAVRVHPGQYGASLGGPDNALGYMHDGHLSAAAHQHALEHGRLFTMPSKADQARCQQTNHRFTCCPHQGNGYCPAGGYR